MSDDPAVQELGRGIARLHLKLSRIQERLDSASVPAPEPASAEAELDALFDLVEAVEAAIHRRRPVHGWLRPLRGKDEDLWRGLAVAAAEARERLRRAGIEPVPVEGPFDPLLHRAIEVVPVSGTRGEGTLAATHRLGWLRCRGGERVVLRTAQVSVHGVPR